MNIACYENLQKPISAICKNPVDKQTVPQIETEIEPTASDIRMSNTLRQQWKGLAYWRP